MRIKKIVSVLLCGLMVLHLSDKILATAPETNGLSTHGDEICEDMQADIRNFGDFLKCVVSEDKPMFISEDYVFGICEAVKPVLKADLNLVKVNGPTIIVGDTHSNFYDTKIYIEKFLKLLNSNPNTKILFLGDYIDRGWQCKYGGEGVKNLTVLYMLKIIFPNNVYVLRGNHEDVSVCKRYGTFEECELLYGKDNKVFDEIVSTFSYLPLSAIVNDDTFCVHGGISENFDLNTFNNNDRLTLQLHKPVEGPDTRTEFDHTVSNLLWSDPDPSDASEDVHYYENKQRGKGKLFNKSAVDKFLNDNHLTRIIRAHEFKDQGYEKIWNGKLITLFSSSGYLLSRDDKGKLEGENTVSAVTYYEPNQPLKIAALAFSDEQQERQLSDFREI